MKKERERQKEKDRIDREENFKARYSRAFPTWVFYFDFDSDNPETAWTRTHLEKRILWMNAVSPRAGISIGCLLNLTNHRVSCTIEM